MNVIKPLALRKGDAISVVVPAGPPDPTRIDRAIKRLQRHGFRTKTYGDLYRSRGYLAGDDATRARELMDAFTDPDTTAVWCARGGYGIVRLLDQLDFDVIRHHPKVFIGFSDITALHLAIQQRVGLITFHGPNLQDGFGAIDIMTAMTDTALWQAMLADAQSWSQPEYSLPPSSESNVAPRMLAPGIARGRLTGGNLSVLSGLLGTPFEIDTAGRILFLEDVDEPPYRIDRYLSQLRLAGKLHAAVGVLLGKFTDDRQPVSGETESAITEVLREFFGTLRIPVLSNFPSGHQRTNVTLPMNAMVELRAEGGTVRLLENPVAEIRTNGGKSSS